MKSDYSKLMACYSYVACETACDSAKTLCDFAISFEPPPDVKMLLHRASDALGSACKILRIVRTELEKAK